MTDRTPDPPGRGTENGSKGQTATADHVLVSIVEAVGESTGRDPTDIPPLYEAIDSDALQSLLATASAESTSEVQISFTFAGVTVIVDNHGSVEVQSNTPDGSEL